MISYFPLMQIVISFVGIVSAVATFWIGNYFNWPNEMEIVISLFIAVSTVIVQMIIAFTNLKNSISRLYPALELSVEEQRTINKSLIMADQLKRRKKDAFAKISIENFSKSQRALELACQNSDYVVNDIFSANLQAVLTLKKGDVFCGLSALVRPEFWKYGQYIQDYKTANYKQVAKGAIIKRVFLFYSENQFNNMNEIMAEQANAGIEVYYVLKEEIKDIHNYPDISVIQKQAFGIFTQREEMIKRVTITNNEETVAMLQSQFDAILERSQKYTVNKELE